MNGLKLTRLWYIPSTIAIYFIKRRSATIAKAACLLYPAMPLSSDRIYIMMENFAPDASGADFHDGYLAEVRWCQKLLPEKIDEFKVGVKYYQTIIK